MLESITSFFSTFPPEITTILMAMTPIGELRLSLPVAVLAFHFPIWKAVLLSVVGNAIPAMIILLFAKRFHAYVDKKTGLVSKGWLKALHRAQEKFAGDYQKYGLIGLMIFIGIPLPMTGAWTGALAAFVFGIPFRKSWPYVLGGIVISAFLTLLVTVGADKIF
ncbi:MAG: small multi-drug export protein [Candidatus Magasanikbacteria bacterium]|nr:small multi-drug export protein [Candidatus Magasanikbacteria bacterium]